MFQKKNDILLLLLLLMLTGSLLSRVLLSVSTMVFVALACINRKFITQIKSTFLNPVTISITLLLFIPLISGLWSSNQSTWLGILRIKLPFLLLPLAFSGDWKVEERKWHFFAKAFLFLVLIATVWSITIYMSDTAFFNESYLKAKTIPVPMNGDHIRFSWLVCIAVATSLLLLDKIASRQSKILLLILAVWFIFYLHVLAARTGILACYIFLLIHIIYLLSVSKRKQFYWLVAILVLLIATFCWFLFPTLQNKLRYMKYTFSFIKTNDYLPGSSDGNRVLSLKAGWGILKENPLGVGAGDVRDEISVWYDKNVPGILKEDKVYPSNEWLVHGDFAGWPGVLLFTIAIALPLFIKKISKRIYWINLHLIAITVCMVDTSLEVQFGIFIYAFTVLWWWKWLNAEIS